LRLDRDPAATMCAWSTDTHPLLSAACAYVYDDEQRAHRERRTHRVPSGESDCCLSLSIVLGALCVEPICKYTTCCLIRAARVLIRRMLQSLRNQVAFGLCIVCGFASAVVIT
jgi:hypothetical protein